VWLASIGFASLIYDKRGAGESDGSEEEIEYFSFENLADDVVAAVNQLKKYDQIDTTKIGLHASSQGGWVAPLAAGKTNSISFMIMRSVSAVSVKEDRIFERGERLRSAGFAEADIAASRRLQELEGINTHDPGAREFDRLFQKAKDEDWLKGVYGADTGLSELARYRDWYSGVAGFDPIPLLQDLDIPVIWIFGDERIDKFGPVLRSIENLKMLQAAGKDYEILQFQGQGHNIEESEYENSLYLWLSDKVQDEGHGFLTHLDAFKKYQAQRQ
jgi:pimeloyl-ACP methyl ester carboxylesterase